LGDVATDVDDGVFLNDDDNLLVAVAVALDLTGEPTLAVAASTVVANFLDNDDDSVLGMLAVINCWMCDITYHIAVSAVEVISSDVIEHVVLGLK
jgi:hypothetical protein